MIAILNLEPEKTNKVHVKYEIKINHKHIAFFYHKRKDGLAVMFEKAREAVKKEFNIK